VPLSPFSLSTRSIPELETHLAPDQFKQIAFSTTPGTVSQFRPTPDGGLIAYVKQKLPMDDVKMKADMPNFLATLRSARQNEAFNMWFRKEAEKGLRDIPQTPPTPTMSSRAGKAT
jgi:parvulin-like peptidyl-prolyl isomerase